MYPLIIASLLFINHSAFAATEAGKAISVTGRVFARNESPTPGSRQLKSGDPLFQGDIINTPSNGATKLLMSDKSMIDLGASALFKVDEYKEGATPGERKVQLSLSYGKIRVAVNTAIKGSGKFAVKTRSAVMGVRGTEFVVLSDLESFVQPPKAQGSSASGSSASQDSGKTQITVIKGKVDVDTKSSSSANPTKTSLTEGSQLTTKNKDSSESTEKEDTQVTKLSKTELKEVQKDAKQEDKTFTHAVAIDDSSGGREETMSDLADGFELPADFIPNMNDMRMPGAFGLDLWSFNASIINANINNLSSLSGISKVKVSFNP